MNFDAVIQDPVSRFSLAIFKLNGLLMRNGDRITRSVGQSSAKWQVLGRAGHGPQSVAQMARDMGLARQSVQRVADVLAQAGLVIFRDNPNDQRTFLVDITKQGATVLARIYEKNGEWVQRLLKRLNSEELMSAAAGLERIAFIMEGLDQDEEINEPDL